MRLLDSDDFDVALLDVHLGDKTVFAFAAELDKRGTLSFRPAYGGRAYPSSFRTI